MIELRQAEGPWVPNFGGLSQLLGAVWVYFQEVVRLVQSVLLYGAEVWGCLRCLEPLEQVQLRALQSYFGVPTSHPRTSLLAKMEVLSVGWEARISYM